jgi:signal transduction histidine kinase
LRHGARRVCVTVQQDRLLLDDDGPGLPAERLQTLQTALDREDYADFTGLGLILSDLVARAHGGRLELGHGALGGLRAVLWLPAD